MALQEVSGTIPGAVDVLMAEINALGADIAAIKVKFDLAVADITALRTNQGKLVVDITAIRTALTAHTHGGVTAGAGTTSAVAALDALTAGAPGAVTTAVAPSLTKQGLKKSGPE